MRSVATDAARWGRHDIVETIEDGLRRYADTLGGRSDAPSSGALLTGRTVSPISARYATHQRHESRYRYRPR
jgi:hypothetical protein